MRCESCNSVMVETLSFSKEKKERFFRCSQCDYETEHQTIDDNHDFEELFQNELSKYD